MSTYEILLLVVVVGFSVLVFCGIYLSVSLARTLKSVNQTLASLQEQVNTLNDEPKHLIHNANALSKNVHYKMECLDPLFATIHNIGEALNASTLKYKDEVLFQSLYERLHRKEESRADQAAEAIELALRGVNLFQKFKKKH